MDISRVTRIIPHITFFGKTAVCNLSAWVRLAECCKEITFVYKDCMCKWVGHIRALLLPVCYTPSKHCKNSILYILCSCKNSHLSAWAVKWCVLIFISYMEAAFSQCTAIHFSSWPQWWSNIYSEFYFWSHFSFWVFCRSCHRKVPYWISCW